jgi:two-component system, NarL family, response regulator NreC
MSSGQELSPANTPDQAGGVRIVLADDHRVVRDGLRLVLAAEPGFEVIAQVGDVASACRCVREHHPDVLLLDLNMPGGSALDAIPGLRSEAPDTHIVVLTMSDDPAYVSEAARAGAHGYVLKEQATSDLIDAIRAVLAGRRYLSRDLADRLSAERIRRGSWD